MDSVEKLEKLSGVKVSCSDFAFCLSIFLLQLLVKKAWCSFCFSDDLWFRSLTCIVTILITLQSHPVVGLSLVCSIV